MSRRRIADITLRAFSTQVAQEINPPWRLLNGPSRVIFLIHGYNVSDRQAVWSLDFFRTLLVECSPSLQEDIFTCSWAGNWDWPVVAPAAYPFMLRNARSSALSFVEFIEKLYARPSPPAELIFVAHSLGCRLALETVRNLRERGRPRGLEKLSVVLMAAAVPAEHLAKDGLLETALELVDRMAVFHSVDDKVLALAFGLGQTLANDGFFPEAIGRRGAPGLPGWMSEDMTGFDHGDYLGETEAAEKVCKALGLLIRIHANRLTLSQRKLLAGRQLPATPWLSMAAPR